MKIYIDDLRTPADNTWTICRSFKEFQKLIIDNYDKFKEPNLCDLEISFDHDLGIDEFHKEMTGLDCAKLLIHYKIIPKMFWVHSSNTVGSENIISLLNNWYKFNNNTTRGYRHFWQYTLDYENS